MSEHVIPHTTRRAPMAAHHRSTAEYAAVSGSESYSGFESESLGGSFDSSPDQECTDPALGVDDGRASRPEEKQAVGVQNTGILIDLQDDGACLRGVEISISDPEKRQGSNAVNMRELFTVYLVEARFVDGDREPTSVWRRYSEFEVLRNYLLVTHPYVVIPPLPEKRAEFVWHKLSADNMDPDFVERRRVGLETFLLRVIEHLQLSRDPIVSSFLSQENGWKETVNNTEFQAKADSLLKSLSATFRVKNPDKRFVELKCYCDELHTIISQLLKVQMRVADRLYGIYKIHANYGRVFSEWSAIEKDMGDGLQSAGHHMDVYAVSIDDMLEEEEHYADHLKEFLYYTESLRSVCSKHELLQYELEQLQYALLAKKQQREELSTGVSGPYGMTFLGSWVGGVVALISLQLKRR
uniref:Sorting nexin 4 n=1 Tax=Eptatretus burgeri TaxID=7764 RepID=A0A8C4QGN5_EPTBU